MPQSPLGDLPLSSSPYNSRITSQYGSEDKNYVMVAFNPGYALQASELNEIQELFFLNQSLTTRMQGIWSQKGYPKNPFWEGLIPLDPDDVTTGDLSIFANGSVSVPVTINSGWFLWTDSESKLSFWIYLNSSASQTMSTSPAGSVTTEYIEYIGFDITKETIICCPTTDCGENDETLRDNSSGSSENFFTCGASRIKATIDPTLEIRDAIASNFYPILKITVTPSGGSFTATVTYMDGQTLITNE